MFAPLSRLFRVRPDPAEHEHTFIKTIQVTHPREPRSRRSERVLLIGWGFILVKCCAIWWLCRVYPQVPVSAWSVIAPSLAFALLCTVLYWRRD